MWEPASPVALALALGPLKEALLIRQAIDVDGIENAIDRPPINRKRSELQVFLLYVWRAAQPNIAEQRAGVNARSLAAILLQCKVHCKS